MENIVETYGGITIYKEGDFYYIKCRNREGRESRIESRHLSAIKRKITNSFKYDNLKLYGEYVYIYF